MNPMNNLLLAGYVQKDKSNSFHRYKYASDEAVTAKIRHAMHTSGLYVSSAEIVRLDTGTVTTKDGDVMQAAVIQFRFMFCDEVGNQYGPYEGAGSALDKGDKAVMKAMTAARKYALSQAALVSWGDDPEADATVDAAVEGKPAVSHEPVSPEAVELAKEQLLGRFAAEGTEAAKGEFKKLPTRMQSHLRRYESEWMRENLRGDRVEA